MLKPSRFLVNDMTSNGHDLVLQHTRVYRPWGWYEGLNRGDRYQVKCIMVKPGGKLSLQSHHHRSEHWVVVRGTLEVVRGEETKLLTENQFTYIPIGEKHRLSNPGKIPAFLIEVRRRIRRKPRWGPRLPCTFAFWDRALELGALWGRPIHFLNAELLENVPTLPKRKPRQRDTQ